MNFCPQIHTLDRHPSGRSRTQLVVLPGAGPFRARLAGRAWVLGHTRVDVFLCGQQNHRAHMAAALLQPRGVHKHTHTHTESGTRRTRRTRFLRHRSEIRRPGPGPSSVTWYCSPGTTSVGCFPLGVDTSASSVGCHSYAPFTSLTVSDPQTRARAFWMSIGTPAMGARTGRPPRCGGFSSVMYLRRVFDRRHGIIRRCHGQYTSRRSSSVCCCS